MEKSDGLNRFVEAQQDTYDDAFTELQDGRKKAKWMWFVFRSSAARTGLSSPILQRQAA